MTFMERTVFQALSDFGSKRFQFKNRMCTHHGGLDDSFGKGKVVTGELSEANVPEVHDDVEAEVVETFEEEHVQQHGDSPHEVQRVEVFGCWLCVREDKNTVTIGIHSWRQACMTETYNSRMD